MTWCSADSATPRFVLASPAIRCRFVDRFVRPKVLSRVSRQRLSSRGASLSSLGSRWVQFPAVISNMKALRLPAAHPRSLICFASGVHADLRVRARLTALPDRRRIGKGQGHWSAGDPIAGVLSRGRKRDLSGSQAIHPMPLPRSKTPAGSTSPRQSAVSPMLPPPTRRRRLQRGNDIEATAGLQHLLPTLHEWRRRHPCKARFRLAGSPLPGGSRTLWTAMKGFRSCHPPFLGLS